MSKLPHRAHEILVAAGGAVVLPQWPVELDPDPGLAGCLVVAGEPDGAEPVVTVYFDPVLKRLIEHDIGSQAPISMR